VEVFFDEIADKRFSVDGCLCCIVYCFGLSSQPVAEDAQWRIPLLLASYHLGWKKGIAVGLLSIPLQYMTGQIWFLDFGQFTLDYIIAFGIYGIASLFPNYKMFFSGVLITNGIRFISSTLSGMWYFGLPLWESGAYNATYMVPTTLACLVLVPLVYARMSRFIKKA